MESCLENDLLNTIQCTGSMQSSTFFCQRSVRVASLSGRVGVVATRNLTCRCFVVGRRQHEGADVRKTAAGILRKSVCRDMNKPPPTLTDRHRSLPAAAPGDDGGGRCILDCWDSTGTTTEAPPPRRAGRPSTVWFCHNRISMNVNYGLGYCRRCRPM